MTGAGFRPEAFRFLQNLADNNTREWFDANRTDYESLFKGPAARLRAGLAEALSDLTGRAMASKQFRINRDIRFSKDKTPYNAHVRMAFWPEGAAFDGKDAQPPSFFVSLEPDLVRIGTGCMAFSRPVLGAFLAALEAGEGAMISDLLQSLQGQRFETSEPDLARVPRGFPKDHPHAELARHKGLAAFKTLDDLGLVQDDAAASTLARQWAPTLPFWHFLTSLQERT